MSKFGIKTKIMSKSKIILERRIASERTGSVLLVVMLVDFLFLAFIIFSSTLLRDSPVH